MEIHPFFLVVDRKKFQSIKLSDRIIIEDMAAENKRRQRQKVHEKFTLLHKKCVVFANGEKNRTEEGIDKLAFGRYNVFLGTTRRMKDMKEKILHEI